jgi:hypothetical protein
VRASSRGGRGAQPLRRHHLPGRQRLHRERGDCQGTAVEISHSRVCVLPCWLPLSVSISANGAPLPLQLSQKGEAECVPVLTDPCAATTCPVGNLCIVNEVGGTPGNASRRGKPAFALFTQRLRPVPGLAAAGW